MAYEKQNFKNGDILTAKQLISMENGILEMQKAAEEQAEIAAQQAEIAAQQANNAKTSAEEASSAAKTAASNANKANSHATAASSSALFVHDALTAIANFSESAKADAESAKKDAATAQEILEKVESQAQADQDENDETSGAYIKNRTHWKEVIPEEVLVSERTLKFPLLLNETSIDPFTGNFIPGMVYRVLWKTEYYDVVAATSESGNVYLGNYNLVDDTVAPTEHIFCLVKPRAYYRIDVYSNHKVSTQRVEIPMSVTQIEQSQYHSLDERYLPDAIRFPEPSDWAQNDPAQKGYVANRTHWKEVLTDAEVVFSEVEIDCSSGFATGNVTPSKTLAPGEKYTAVVDGVEYDLVCEQGTDYGSDTYVGNYSLVDSSVKDSGHDFCIVCFEGQIFNFYSTVLETRTFILTTAEEAIYHKLDKKYLPDDIGGGVSSWNDLTDRPFYSEIDETEVLPETTIEFDPENGEGYLMDLVDVVAGNTYTVVWNGVEYPCTAASFDLNGIPVTLLGNIGAMTGEGMTEEPFLLLAFPAEIAAEMGAGGAFMALDGSTSATVFINEVTEIIHPIDIKYLPEGTPGIEVFNDVILPETEFTVNTPLDVNPNVQTGIIYDVVYNGVTYQLEPFHFVDGLGKTTILTLGRYTADAVAFNETTPFALKLVSGENGSSTVVETFDDTTSGTIAITNSRKVHKIDERCMPDTSEVFFFEFSGDYIDPTSTRFTPIDVSISDVYRAFTKNKLCVCRVIGSDDGIYLVDYADNTYVVLHRVSSSDGSGGATCKIIVNKLLWQDGHVTQTIVVSTAEVIRNSTIDY